MLLFIRHDKKGFTIVELLVSAAIFIVILLGIYLMYETNQTTFLKGEKKTNIQQNARIAMDQMETEIRMAGYGVPTATSPSKIEPIITAASATSISFLADIENASTTLSASAYAPTTSVTVVSAAGFSAKDSIYITDGLKWQQLVIARINKRRNIITFTPALTGSYGAGSMVTRPRTIVYSLVCDNPPCSQSNPYTLKRDAGDGAGAQPLAEKISSLTFAYYDSTNATIPISSFPARLKDIRRISISISTSDAVPGQAPETFALTSEVRPRNLDL